DHSLEGNRSNEHIIQDALGGTEPIRSVCKTCNNGVLSRIDQELVSRSPLSILVVDTFGKKLTQGWEVDQSERNLLLEAQMSWGEKVLTVWPQLVLDYDRPKMYGDAEQQRKFGIPEYQRKLSV